MQPTLPERDHNGQLPAFAWPGGYPILYLDSADEILCAKCATKALDDAEADERARPVAYFVHYEGSSEFCADCNVETESSYGDPAEEKGA